jgi:hypothetical protein
MSLGDDVRAYVRRKFGEHEAGQIVISHESLRYLIADFTIAWLNIREAERKEAAKLDEEKL